MRRDDPILMSVPAGVIAGLETWARWMKTDDDDQGYPASSAGFNSGGSVKSFEDLEHSADAVMAQGMDAIVEGLEVWHKLAIDNLFMGRVWRLARLDFDEVALEALQEVWVAMRRRGLI